MEEKNKKINPLTIVLVVIIIALLGVICYLVLSDKKSSDKDTIPNTQNNTNTEVKDVIEVRDDFQYIFTDGTINKIQPDKLTALYENYNYSQLDSSYTVYFTNINNVLYNSYIEKESDNAKIIINTYDEQGNKKELVNANMPSNYVEGAWENTNTTKYAMAFTLYKTNKYISFYTVVRPFNYAIYVYDIETETVSYIGKFKGAPHGDITVTTDGENILLNTTEDSAFMNASGANYRNFKYILNEDFSVEITFTNPHVISRFENGKVIVESTRSLVNEDNSFTNEKKYYTYDYKKDSIIENE